MQAKSPFFHRLKFGKAVLSSLLVPRWARLLFPYLDTEPLILTSEEAPRALQLTPELHKTFLIVLNGLSPRPLC